MKSEEILLKEARSGYTRQRSALIELTHKSHNFLQLNGLLLTIIFIGIGLQREGEWVSMLAVSALFIIVSATLGALAALSQSVKEVKVELESKAYIADKERDITLALIEVYNKAQEDVISKYNKRRTTLDWSVSLLVPGLFVLFVFTLITAAHIVA